MKGIRYFIFVVIPRIVQVISAAASFRIYRYIYISIFVALILGRVMILEHSYFITPFGEKNGHISHLVLRYNMCVFIPKTIITHVAPKQHHPISYAS